ncbi:hypothetical protein [Hyphobacterium indicum]|uniref:hypothetical protein n=1 Tax=Hyphobacterium indicum TaxID=2162714 RepID=UPI000D649E35|nr:hypothetical protein [Hyphobacterium indicum]
MIELALALLLQSAQPAETACILDVKTRRRGDEYRIIEVDVGCPPDAGDAAALQAVAERTVSLMDTGRIRHAGLLTAREVRFRRADDGSWQAVPGQMVISIPATMPVRMMMDGYRTLSCSWATEPDFRGRPASPRVTCYVDGSVGPGHAIRAGENMVEEVIRNTRFLPAPAAYCFQDEVRVVSTAIDVTGGRYNNDNAITPDTRPLPQLCG